jgi:hypothetical protein
MTGTTGDIIAIVIVPVVVLAFWLAMMYYADSHPRWGSQAPADTVSANALDGSGPAQRLINPGPVVPGQRTGCSMPATCGSPAPGTTLAGLGPKNNSVRPLKARLPGFFCRLRFGREPAGRPCKRLSPASRPERGAAP